MKFCGERNNSKVGFLCLFCFSITMLRIRDSAVLWDKNALSVLVYFLGNWRLWCEKSWKVEGYVWDLVGNRGLYSVQCRPRIWESAWKSLSLVKSRTTVLTRGMCRARVGFSTVWSILQLFLVWWTISTLPFSISRIILYEKMLCINTNCFSEEFFFYNVHVSVWRSKSTKLIVIYNICIFLMENVIGHGIKIIHQIPTSPCHVGI